MRAGVIISAVSHVLLVLLALLGTPKMFDSTLSPSIEVDLVPSEQVDTPPNPEPEKKPEPEKAKKDAFGLAAEQGGLQPEATPPAQVQPQRAADKTQQAAPTPQQQTAAAPQPAPGPAWPGLPQKPAPSIFDPINIPTLLDLPNSAEKGFDAESMTAANLSADERATFKAHLRKCWKLPGGAAPAANTRIVLRVYLRRDASLASDPVLIEAKASPDGVVVMQTAMRALKDCQPYGFLPPDKYAEWRVLDLSFTPREMAGG
jgi:hypothetical protein